MCIFNSVLLTLLLYEQHLKFIYIEIDTRHLRFMTLLKAGRFPGGIPLDSK